MLHIDTEVGNSYNTYMYTKFLVTGGAGFIGSHIVEYLVAQGKDVVVIDDLSTGSIRNLDNFFHKITFYEGSILDRVLLEKAMEGVECVFHQAAIPSVPKSIKNPIETHTVNTTGTIAVFDVAKNAHVKRVVYASSSSVYGDSPTLPKIETMGYNPLSPYAVQKMTGEYYGKLYYKIFGLETVGLRYFNVFGPRQNPDSEYAAVIPKFIKKIKSDTPVTIYGDGETTRDFTYIDNVVHANMQASIAERAPGEVFNIALGSRISLNELVRAINTLFGKNINPIYEDFRGGDIKHSLADISKAQNILKYDPMVSFSEGLQKTADTFSSSTL